MTDPFKAVLLGCAASLAFTATPESSFMIFLR